LSRCFTSSDFEQAIEVQNISADLCFQDETPLGYTYTTEVIAPHVALVPILRSGLGMLEGDLVPVDA